MNDLDRRTFVFRSLAAGKAAASAWALNALAAACAGRPDARPRVTASIGDGGYGPLRDVGPELALPAGFSYRVIGVEGSIMSDGHPTPGRHDGMAAFPLANGNIRLIRNHEVDNQPRLGAAIGDPRVAYDQGAGGGTTSLEIHPQTREVVRDFVSLNGTWRNCAGGPTPWGSWLSCEEGFFGEESGFGAPHGYVFEVPVDRQQAEKTEPLVALGRFVHEAVAVDPHTGIIYETEDQFEAGFYRFLPNRPYRPGVPGDLRAGGVLQMLAVDDRPRFDARRRQTVGRPLRVHWVDIDEVDPQGGPEDRSVVFRQGYDQGGARFSRLEGCRAADDGIYFVATDGGDAGFGQVWHYRPTDPDRGLLTLVFESPGQGVLNRPDNVTVSPRGAIILCEDGFGRREYVRGITRDGKVFDIAANLMDESEVAGATFSPDGQTLFFNVMGNRARGDLGMTFAVWGPWQNGAV